MATTGKKANKELVREYHEVIESGAVDRIPEFFATGTTVDLMEHESGESEATDVDELAEEARKWVAGFPDATIEEKEMVAEGDWVLCRTMTEGTHEGEFMGIEPTGREIIMQRHESYRIENGEFVEVHGTGSLAWLLAQLGVDLPIEG